MRIRFGEALIAPIPNEATGQRRFLEEGVNISADRAVGIAHGMGEFAQDQRAIIAARFLSPARPIDDVFDRRVHWTDDVCCRSLGRSGR